jgi:Ran GTPase-activating protein 1
LNLRDSSLQSKAAFIALGKVFKTAAAPLIFLDLSGNDFEADAGCDELYQDIFSAASLRRHVQHLALDDNMMEGSGAVSLAKALKRYKSLKTLSVNCCDITAKGAVALAKAVSSVKSFETLKMDGNMICEEGVGQVTAIMEFLNKTLEEMEDNDDDGEDDLAELEDEEDEEEEEEDEEEEDGTGKDGDADVDHLDQIMAAVKIGEGGVELRTV